MTSSTPSALSEWSARRVIEATLVVLLVVLGFWLLYRFRLVVFTLFAAIVISTALRPIANRLERIGITRSVSVILIYLLLLGLLVGFIVLLVPLLVEQVTTIGSTVSDYYVWFRTLLVNSSNRLIWRVATRLPEALTIGARPQQPVDEALDMVGQAIFYTGLIGQTVFVLIAVMLLAYYWTQDGERTLRSILLLVPRDRRETTRELIAAMEGKVGAFIRGQAILCTVVGGMSFVAYALIGLPYALLLALIAGILEAVPVIGPIVSIVPAVLLALSLAPSKVLWVIVAAVAIQQLESSLLVPRVMDRTVGVNGLVTILSLVGFTSLLGLPGALLAIPMAAIIQLLLDRFVLGLDAIEQDTPDGRDYLSKLRYEAQELVRDVRKQIRHKEEEVSEHTDAVEDEIESIATDLDSILARAEVQEGEA